MRKSVSTIFLAIYVLQHKTPYRWLNHSEMIPWLNTLVSSPSSPVTTIPIWNISLNQSSTVSTSFTANKQKIKIL